MRQNSLETCLAGFLDWGISIGPSEVFLWHCVSPYLLDVRSENGWFLLINELNRWWQNRFGGHFYPEVHLGFTFTSMVHLPLANIGHCLQLWFPVMQCRRCDCGGGCGLVLTFASHVCACLCCVILSTHCACIRIIPCLGPMESKRARHTYTYLIRRSFHHQLVIDATN